MNQGDINSNTEAANDTASKWSVANRTKLPVDQTTQTKRVLDWQTALIALGALVVIGVGAKVFFFGGDDRVDQQTYEEVSTSMSRYYAAISTVSESQAFTKGLSTDFVTEEFQATSQSTNSYAILLCAQNIGNDIAITNIVKAGGDDVEVQAEDNTPGSEDGFYSIVMRKVNGIWKIHSADCSN